MDKQIGVIGARLWSGRLAQMLENHTPLKCRLVCEFSINDFWRIPLIFVVRRVVRVGFRPGVFRLRGILIDLVSLIFVIFGGELVFYWTGSDVQRTSRMLFRNSRRDKLWGIPICRLMFRKARHCCAAPWLVDELSYLGIEAENLPFPSPTLPFEELGTKTTKWPERFSVLSYIPDHGFENYCGRELLEVAKLLPDIDFRIMGGGGSWCEKPPSNLTFLGWTDAVQAYLNSVIVIRMVKHDALGGTVREALLCGRYVVYSFPHNYTTLLSSEEERIELVCNLKSVLQEFFREFSKGRLETNQTGRKWVVANLSERALAEAYYQWFVGGVAK